MCLRISTWGWVQSDGQIDDIYTFTIDVGGHLPARNLTI
jgi:hypothetical protein